MISRDMRAIACLTAIIFFAGAAGAEPQSVGIFGQWGAFRDASANRCYAISEPRTTGARSQRPFAAIGFWPRRGVRAQIHFRLSGAKRPGSAILLRIDDRTFQLIGGGRSAWASDRREDAEIVSAMRRGLNMTIETRSDRGLLIRDGYFLRGAATAIDAAAIACAR